ncbi:MAG: 1,4-dihydroxy-2-naphthoate polyprenyltransferase [Planctomycetes bacterium]|nr:1,4-dihydroxy-2-naphthoate polyprenyltransferase [Planctomycetota bacterium]
MTLTLAPEARPAAAAVWWSAARPATLAASLAPVIAGTALAARTGGARWDAALCALAGAVLIQVGTNLHNDAADHARGADGPERLGPPRATAQGWLDGRAVRRAAALVLALAFVPGAYLVALGGWPILALGVASVLCAVLYTGGPWPLAYVGLGEVFVVGFFGLAAVAGTVFVQTGAVGVEALVVGLALGLVAAAILAVNNLRDREGDARAGKRTLAVRLGARFARAEHAACLLLPFALFVALWARDGWAGWLLPLLALPLAGREVALARRADGRDLNARLGGAGRVELGVALLLALGVAVA